MNAPDARPLQSGPFVDASRLEWESVGPGLERQLLGYDAGLMMVRVRFAKGAVGAVHHHPHRQVSYVETGVFEVQIGDREQVLQAGDSFIVEPNTPHGVAAREAGVLIDVFSPAREDFLTG